MLYRYIIQSPGLCKKISMFVKKSMTKRPIAVSTITTGRFCHAFFHKFYMNM